MVVSMEVNGVLYSGVLFASNNSKSKSDLNKLPNNSLTNSVAQEFSKLIQQTNGSLANSTNQSESVLSKTSINNNNVNDNKHNAELNLEDKIEQFTFENDGVNEFRLNDMEANGDSDSIINDTTLSVLIASAPNLSEITNGST